MKKKNPSSFRLSPEALRLLAALAEELAISQGAVLELAIRDFAKRKGVS